MSPIICLTHQQRNIGFWWPDEQYRFSAFKAGVDLGRQHITPVGIAEQNQMSIGCDEQSAKPIQIDRPGNMKWQVMLPAKGDDVLNARAYAVHPKPDPVRAGLDMSPIGLAEYIDRVRDTQIAGVKQNPGSWLERRLERLHAWIKLYWRAVPHQRDPGCSEAVFHETTLLITAKHLELISAGADCLEDGSQEADP